MNFKFRTRFNRTPVAGVRFDKPSLVQSQFKHACDINAMIKRALGGDMSVFRSPGNMVDVSDVPDSYHEAMNILVRAEQSWDILPDALKRAYGNPANYVREYEKSLNEKLRSSSPVKDVSPMPDKATSVSTDSHPEGAEDSMPKSAPNT